MLLYLHDHGKTRCNPRAIATVKRGEYGTHDVGGTGIDGIALYINGSDNRILYVGERSAAVKQCELDLQRIENAMSQ